MSVGRRMCGGTSEGSAETVLRVRVGVIVVNGVIRQCDALESCISTCSLCVHLFFSHIDTIPLSSSPQPGTTPDLPSILECIPS